MTDPLQKVDDSVPPVSSLANSRPARNDVQCCCIPGSLRYSTRKEIQTRAVQTLEQDLNRG